MRPDGSELRQVGSNLGGSLPRWSPDGTRIALWFPSAERVVIVSLDAALRETSRETVLLRAKGGGLLNVGGWSPDGRRLLLANEEPYTWKKTHHVYDIEAHRAVLLAVGDLLWFRWLDDGHLLGAGPSGLTRVSWPGGAVEALSEPMDDGDTTWSMELSDDGSTLILVRGTETVGLRVLELAAPQP